MMFPPKARTVAMILSVPLALAACEPPGARTGKGGPIAFSDDSYVPTRVIGKDAVLSPGGASLYKAVADVLDTANAGSARVMQPRAERPALQTDGEHVRPAPRQHVVSSPLPADAPLPSPQAQPAAVPRLGSFDPARQETVRQPAPEAAVPVPTGRSRVMSRSGA